MTEHIPCTLLIFEDDANILAMLRTYFKNQGTRVVTADNGAGAYELIEQTAPDVILLDIIMPHQDGFTILGELREKNNQTPVIILTDQNRVDDKVTGLELGADDYVAKPFSLRELSARVQAQLRRAAVSSKTRHATIKIGPLTIDTKARETTDEKQRKIALTKTEFELFSYLGRHLNSVVPHKELLQNVLGYDPNTETKALVMHITNLRKKLDASAPGTIQISAVPGVGYKLSVLK